LTVPDTSTYVLLDEPADQSSLAVMNSPTFVWHAQNLDTFKVQFSNHPSFPSRSFKDRGRTAKTVTVAVEQGESSLTPSASTWKAIRTLAGAMDGTLYWRVRGIDPEKAFGAASDPVPMILDRPVIQLSEPADRRDGTVKPGEVFTLDWSVDGEGYPFYEIQVSSSDSFLKGRTISLKKLQAKAYQLTLSDVKKVRSLCTKAATDTFYWRVIATDVDKVISIPSEKQAAKFSEEPAGGGS